MNPSPETVNTLIVLLVVNQYSIIEFTYQSRINRDALSAKKKKKEEKLRFTFQKSVSRIGVASCTGVWQLESGATMILPSRSNVTHTKLPEESSATYTRTVQNRQ